LNINKEKKLTIRVDGYLDEALNNASKEYRVGKSEMIRSVLGDWLAELYVTRGEIEKYEDEDGEVHYSRE